MFDAAGWGSEIVVCDNNSTDDTAGVAKAAGVRVVFEPFNQIAASRNAAGRAAKGGGWFSSMPTRACRRSCFEK